MPTKRRTGPGRQDQPLHAGSPSQRRGRMAEDAALALMLAAGHRVIQRNFHCRLGEIDLITLHGRLLIFTEVRQRSTRGHGSAIDTVTPAKQMRLIATARYFLACHPQLQSSVMRFDVIACDGSAADGPLDWLQTAFTLDETFSCRTRSRN